MTGGTLDNNLLHRNDWRNIKTKICYTGMTGGTLRQNTIITN